MAHKNNPDSSRSLIAFVQKHRLNVTYCSKAWTVYINPYIPILETGHDFHWCEGKTWTAAVRKAKRMIEGGKK